MNHMLENSADAPWNETGELSEEVQDKLDKFKEIPLEAVIDVYYDTFGEDPENPEEAEERLIEAIKNEGNVQF